MSKNTCIDYFYSGTSGLCLPFNKAQYPVAFKDKSRLQYYSSLYNCVEINSVFYKLPKMQLLIIGPKTVVENVEYKKGCLLAQFPSSLTIEQIAPFKELLEIFIHLLKSTSWKPVTELRHPSWHIPRVYEMLSDFKVSMVLHDMKNSPANWNNVYNDLVYLRFHGPELRYRGSYSDEFLKQRGESIKKWISQEKTVFVYFNNTMGADFDNLQTLNKFVNT